MSRVTLAVPELLWEELTAALADGVETAAVVVAGWAEGATGDFALLMRQIHWVAAADYLERNSHGLVIASSGYVRGLRRAADDRSIALFLHTHPGGSPKFSERDDKVHQSLVEPFLIRTRSPWMGSAVLGGDKSAPSLSGVVENAHGHRLGIDRVRLVGQGIRVISALDAHGEPPANFVPSARFDRQVRAFGAEGQRELASLRVGVIGAGGIGSAVAEQLIRLGVGELTVIDDDVVDEANLTRIHSSSRADIGTPKVEVVSQAAADIGFGTRVNAKRARVTRREAAEAIRQCDVVFGCTDDNAGRAVLSRLAYAHLILVIDSGVLIETAGASVAGVHGRVTVVTPGTGCLICRDRIDADTARAEVMSEEERERLAAEGYVPGLGAPAPAVVSFTTLTAAVAVSELLERMFAYGDGPRPSELLVRMHERRIRANSVPGKPEHYCSDRGFWGRGDREPFLGQLWP